MSHDMIITSIFFPCSRYNPLRPGGNLCVTLGMCGSCRDLGLEFSTTVVNYPLRHVEEWFGCGMPSTEISIDSCDPVNLVWRLTLHALNEVRGHWLVGCCSKVLKLNLVNSNYNPACSVNVSRHESMFCSKSWWRRLQMEEDAT